MTPHYQDDSVTLYHGDCLDVLAELDDNSVDSVVTDPPYGLEFMGKDWDAPWKSSSVGRGTRVASERAAELTDRGKGHSTSAGPYLASGVDSVRVAGRPFQDWCEAWSRECLRVLKPGGHMLAFGGSRTWHRLACAVEDAGFEIRDSIAWLYGSGFPKSLDVSKAIDKAAGTERTNGGREWSGGQRSAGILGKNNGTQTRTIYDAPATPDAERWQGWGTALKPAFEPIVVGRKPLVGTVAANVLEHGTGALNVDGCRVRREEGDRTEYGRDNHLPHANTTASLGRFAEVTPYEPNSAGRWPTNVVLDETQAAELDKQSGVSQSKRGESRTSDNRTGGASRFFPTFRYEAKAPTHERPRDGETAHPTVKPLDLMQWLVKLVTPPDGTVLEPFAGSGTTAEACIIEGFNCIAIEREATYLPLIVARLTKPIQVGLDFGEEAS